MTFSSWGHISALPLVFSPLTTRATFTKSQSCTLPFGQLRLHFTTRAHSMKRADGNAFAAARPIAMHEAAGAPPQLTDGVCGAAQSTGAAASRPILQARPLALRLHRERAIVAKNTDLCAADLHGGRAQRRDNRASDARPDAVGPAVRVADPEVADQAHPQRGHAQGQA